MTQTEFTLDIPSNVKNRVANFDLPDPVEGQTGWRVEFEAAAIIPPLSVSAGDVAFIALLGGLSIGSETQRLSVGRVSVLSAGSLDIQCVGQAIGRLPGAAEGDRLRVQIDNSVALLAPNRQIAGEWAMRITVSALPE